MDDVKTGAMPKVLVYPQCPECNVPYVLRKSIVFAINKSELADEWLWQRDCNHKKVTPIVKHMETPRGKAKKKVRTK